MTAKCEFCAGTGIEPGFECCVWCDSAGTKEGQSLFDPAKPGSDITVAATFKLDGKSLRFQRLANIAASCEPVCSICFQRGCNGECYGDDMMGACS